jgi:hypothetical protein
MKEKITISGGRMTAARFAHLYTTWLQQQRDSEVIHLSQRDAALKLRDYYKRATGRELMVTKSGADKIYNGVVERVENEEPVGPPAQEVMFNGRAIM